MHVLKLPLKPQLDNVNTPQSTTSIVTFLEWLGVHVLVGLYPYIIRFNLRAKNKRVLLDQFCQNHS
jgi:hypothetical protein